MHSKDMLELLLTFSLRSTEQKFQTIFILLL